SAVTGSQSERAGEIALVVGLFFSLLSMTTAMAQIERGTNRIYGIGRDRKALAKYGRALVLTAVLAAPVGLGFLMLVAGGSFADAMRATYGWSEGAADVWRWGCSRSRCSSTMRRGAGSRRCRGWRWAAPSPCCWRWWPPRCWRATST